MLPAMSIQPASLPSTERRARLAAMAMAVLGVILLLGAAASSNVQPDADAYWLAAVRLRAGQALYVPGGADQTEIYRYSPWLALAWVPLTYLGQDAAYVVWRSILVAATLVAIWPLLRRPSPAGMTLAILLGGLLASNLQAANVTPLMVALLVFAVRSRAGPLLLGLVAGLKLFPIIFAAGYLAERRWRAAIIAVVSTTALWLGVLAFDVHAFADTGGLSFYVGGVSLTSVSPWVWLPVAIGMLALLGWLAISGSRWTWLAASAFIPLAVPRVWLPDVAYLLVGAEGSAHDRHKTGP